MIENFSGVPAQLRVRMGEWNAAGDTEPLPAQEFVVAKIFIHPNFNPNNLMNDVAVLRLTVPVPLGQLPTITTACLPVTAFVGQRYHLINLSSIRKKKNCRILFYVCFLDAGSVVGAKMILMVSIKRFKKK